MKAILQLQWSMHKSTLFLLISVIGILAYFFRDSGSEISFATFALVFSVNGVSMSKRIFTNQNAQYILYSMPISRQILIKSLYVTSFTICTVIFLLILPIQLYNGFLYNDFDEYIVTFIGLYAGSLLGIAFDLSSQLKNIEEDSWLKSFLSFFGGMMLMFIPHLLLSYIAHEPTFWLRLLIMPAISLIWYVYLMQRGVKKFADRELL